MADSGYLVSNAILPCCPGGGAPPANKLATPATSATGVTQSGFTVDWPDVPNATSYTGQVATDSGYSNIVDNQPGLTSSQFTTSGRLSGTQYFWRVQALDLTGTYLTSDYGTGTVTTAAGLQAPTLGTPKRSSSAAAIPVNNPDGGASIVWQRSTDSTFPGTPATGSITYPQQSILMTTGLTAGTTYYVRAKTVDSSGNETGWSTVVQFTTMNASLSQASATAFGVTLSLAGTTGVERFDFVGIPLGNQSGSNTAMDGFRGGTQEFTTSNTTDYNGTAFSYKDPAGNWHFEVAGGFVSGTKNIS